MQENTPAASMTTEFDVCETLKMRKSYKAILLDTEPRSNLKSPEERHTENIVQQKTQTGDNTSKHDQDTLNKVEELSNKIEKLTKKYDEYIHSDKIDEKIKNAMENMTNDVMTKPTNEDSKHIEKLIDAKLASFEQDQAKKTKYNNDHLMEMIVSVSHSMSKFQLRMETVLNRFTPMSQISNTSEDGQLYTQPSHHHITPQRTICETPMITAPAPKSLRGVGAA